MSGQFKIMTNTNPILVDLPVRIQTPRLLLRPQKPGDGVELNAAIRASQAELLPWMPWAHGPPTVEESELNVRESAYKFLTREDIRYPMFDQKSGQFIGSTGLHRINWRIPSFEIGYWIHSQHTGKGYATEGALVMALLCFRKLGAKRVDIRCDTQNVASIAVAKKLGFELEGCLRSSILSGDLLEARDLFIFSRLNGEGLELEGLRWE